MTYTAYKTIIISFADKNSLACSPVLVRSFKYISSRLLLEILLSLSCKECRRAPAQMKQRNVSPLEDKRTNRFAFTCFNSQLLPIPHKTTSQLKSLLADTGCDLLSICKMIDLLLNELSRFRSMHMGARVAPPSPVGCEYKDRIRHQKTSILKLGIESYQGKLRCRK